MNEERPAYDTVWRTLCGSLHLGDVLGVRRKCIRKIQGQVDRKSVV